jgi:hypothetical protein
MAVGLLDGLLGSIESIYDTGTGVFKRAASIAKYGLELTDTAIRRGALAAVFKLGGDAYAQARALQQNIRQLRTNLKGWIDDGGAKMRRIIEEMARGLRGWLGGLLDLEKDRGYEVGVLLFDVVLAAFSGGTTLGSKFLPQLYRWLERLEHQANGFIWEVLGYAESKADEIPGLRGKISRCKILGKGCFVAGTPVLMAGNTIGQSGKIYALAVDMPVAVMPIDDVPLLSYALANKTVNSSYSMTASSDDVYIGLTSGDPYTSQEQEHRDLYEINDTDWRAVSFQGMYSSSACHLAMHNDWIAQHGYVVDGIVNLNLPEQGITGPFRITSIKHILPQKKPETDPDDGYEWKPVTGLFIHQSDQVHNVSFDNNETLGVTARHPVFSTTYNDWRPAGELEVGEMVLAYHGEVVVTSATKKEEEATVYNLEVKDLHNFLVNASGVVVHNSCLNQIEGYLTRLGRKFAKPGGKRFPNDRPDCKTCKGGFIEKLDNNGNLKKLYIDENEFPFFEEFAQKNSFGQLFKYESDFLKGYPQSLPEGHIDDFRDANNWLQNNLSQLTEPVQFPNGEDSSFVRILKDGKWQEYTWHHHQDGKTLLLVERAIHNGTGHTGGGLLINVGLKGALPGPVNL